ncbi:MAG TPA: barstar family protein [Rhodocyclaceae bacterium]|nr:barstar family protein [Rhodocyclaceae bacterium]
MNTAANKLTHYAQAGVYVASATQLYATSLSAASINFDCWSVDINATQTAPALLRQIGQALHFPQWYGENWDALADCLTDLSWSEADGFIVILRGCDALHTAQPGLWKTLTDILGEVSDFWRENQIAFWVLVDGAADTLPAFSPDR